jgi:hypothetical protein
VLRAWTVPAAAAAAVAVVIGGTVAVRVATDTADPPPARPAAGVPAPLPDVTDPSPSFEVIERYLGIDDWDDMEPYHEYGYGHTPPSPFVVPRLAPGEVSETSAWVDDRGRHALVLTTETEVRDTASTGRRVVVTAMHATLARQGDAGWVVVNRVTHRTDPACARPSVTAQRFGGRQIVLDEDGSAASLPNELADSDRDGHAEVVVPFVSACARDDVTVRIAVLDGPDTYELAGVLGPDLRTQGDHVEPGNRRPLPSPRATPAAAEWERPVLDRAVSAYALSASLVGYGNSPFRGLADPP